MRKAKPKKIIAKKCYAIMVKDSNDLLGWKPMFPLTGAIAVFDKEEKAKAAIKYNDQLQKAEGIKSQYRTIYKVVEVSVSFPNPNYHA